MSLSVSFLPPTSYRNTLNSRSTAFDLAEIFLSSSGGTCRPRYSRYRTVICRASSGSLTPACLIAFNSAKPLRIGKTEVELVFGRLFLLEVGFLAGDVGDPREPIGLDFQRADGRLVIFDELSRLGVDLLVSFESGGGICSRCQQNQPKCNRGVRSRHDILPVASTGTAPFRAGEDQDSLPQELA